jgi:glutathione S-transferase
VTITEYPKTVQYQVTHILNLFLISSTKLPSRQTSASNMSSPKLIVHHLQVGQGERIPWLLEELDIPYELKLYKRSPLLAPPELKAVYPVGASPVLEDLTDPSNPIKFAESGAIAEYIIRKYGNGRLSLAPEHKNFSDYLYWLHFSNGTLQPALFRRVMTRGLVGEQDPRYKSNDERAHIDLKHMNERLLSNTWLAGDEFTAADVMMGWCFTTMRKFEPVDLTEYDGIKAWVDRVGEREAYRRAMGKADPELNIEEGLSVKGPKLVEAWAKVMGMKP